MLKIRNLGGNKMSIDTSGGRLLSLVMGQVKILDSYARIDGKSGSTHVCIPNFADEGVTVYGLPFHGPARSSEWMVVKEDDRSVTISIAIQASQKYRSSLNVTQRFEIANNYFIHHVQVTNTGYFAVPVNIGIHNYFDSPQGWQNTLIDGKLVGSQIANNRSIYKSAQTKDSEKLDTDNRIDQNTFYKWQIVIHGKPPISLNTNASRLMAWSAIKDSRHDDLYLCLEPIYMPENAYFGDKITLLEPQKTRILSQYIFIH
jgi:galactose mutarotase-like enzyme